MEDRCFEPGELDSILRRPAAGVQRHLGRCPRCQALLAVYREFMEDRSVPPGADPGKAAKRLRAAWDEELGRARADFLEGPRRSPRTALLRHLRPRILRPAWALAGVLLVAGTTYLALDLGGDRRPDRLRTVPGQGPDDSRTRVELISAERDPDGAFRISWGTVPGADAYSVRIFGSDLVDVARFGPLPETLLVVSPDEPLGSLPPGTLLGCQIEAWKAGRPIASSPVRAFPAR